MGETYIHNIYVSITTANRPIIFLWPVLSYSFPSYTTSQTNIPYNYLGISHRCIYLLLSNIRIYPCLYLLGKSKAHSLYRSSGLCISLVLNRSSNSFWTSGNNTLLVISVSFSICSGNIWLANNVCIALCILSFISSKLELSVLPPLDLGIIWWLL